MVCDPSGTEVKSFSNRNCTEGRRYCKSSEMFGALPLGEEEDFYQVNSDE